MRGPNRSIVAKAGTDCSEDFDFHRKGGKQLWKQFRAGYVVPCAGKTPASKKKPWLLHFW